MTETNLLIGSLSNDLFRVASLKQRGADAAAIRFLIEAKRWAIPLQYKVMTKYIQDIVSDVASVSSKRISMSQAELYLMYGVLLQNFTLHANQI